MMRLTILRNTLAAAAGAAALATSGCLSALHGTHQKLEIVTVPEGALCRIYRGDEGFVKSVATPGAKYLHRSDDPVRIECSKAGYETARVEVPSAPRGEIVVNAATVGGGLLLDLASGAPYDLPDTIAIELKKAR